MGSLKRRLPAVLSRKRWLDCICSSNHKTRNVPHLPEDIIFSILVWLPADTLHHVMRFVCRNWFNIIHSPDFVEAHLQQSAAGLLIQIKHTPSPAFFLNLDKGTENVKATQVASSALPSLFAASTDGLVLMHGHKNSLVSYVLNPTTKQKVVLPPFDESQLASCCSALAYIPSTNRYKVVHLFNYLEPSCEWYVAILSVGIDDAWTLIGMKIIPHGVAFIKTPATVQGFIYFWDSRSAFVFALNVETEKPHQVPLPKDCAGKHFECLKTENTLAMVIFDSTHQLDFWELTDPESGIWRKLYKIDSHGQGRYNHVLPVAMFKSRNLVIFSAFAPWVLVAYNVKTMKWFSCWKPAKDVRFWIDVHVNSLVPLQSS